MIFVTGDTHLPIDIQKLSTKRFPAQKELTKSDYVIICGDFGGVWDSSNEERYWIDWLKKKSFTTLFVDGNHENFDMLLKLPTEIFCGGTVHKVDEGIYHLIRGEAYNIDGKSIFVFGGAESHDKKWRTEGKNWWKEELPSSQEYKNALITLEKYDHTFDLILTHSAPDSIQRIICSGYEKNELTEFLENVKNKASYKHWYFGHYHIDKNFDERLTAVYDLIHKI